MTVLPFRPRFLPRKTYGDDILRDIARLFCYALAVFLLLGTLALMLALVCPWLRVVG